jgi:hypothetical protein
MKRDKGSKPKHRTTEQNQQLEDTLKEHSHERPGWVRKYLDLADQVFRNDDNDPSPSAA